MKNLVLTSAVLVDYANGHLSQEEALAVEAALLQDQSASAQMDMIWDMQGQGLLESYLAGIGFNTSAARITDRLPQLEGPYIPMAQDLIRYVKGQLPTEEMLKLEEALLDDPKAMQELALLQELQEKGELDTFAANLNSVAGTAATQTGESERLKAETAQEKNQQPKLRIWAPWLPRVAASLALLLTVWVIFLETQNGLPPQSQAVKVRGGYSIAAREYQQMMQQWSESGEVSPRLQLRGIALIYRRTNTEQLPTKLEAALMEAWYTIMPISDLQTTDLAVELHHDFSSLQGLRKNPLVFQEDGVMYRLTTEKQRLELRDFSSQTIHTFGAPSVAFAAFSKSGQEILVIDKNGHSYRLLTPTGILAWLQSDEGKKAVPPLTDAEKPQF